MHFNPSHLYGTANWIAMRVIMNLCYQESLWVSISSNRKYGMSLIYGHKSHYLGSTIVIIWPHTFSVDALLIWFLTSRIRKYCLSGYRKILNHSYGHERNCKIFYKNEICESRSTHKQFFYDSLYLISKC